MLKKFKKLFPLTVVLVAMFVVMVSPAVAVEDVVLSNDLTVELETPGTTVIIASGATMDALVVNAANMVISMAAGAFPVTISSLERYQFTVTGITDPGTTCGDTTSTVVLPAQGSAVDVTVTTGSLCATGGGGGGGGGGGAAPAPTTPATAPSTTTGNVTASATLGGSTTTTTTDGSTAGVTVTASAINVDTTLIVTPVLKTDTAVSTATAVAPTGKSIVGANVYNYTASVGTASVTTFQGDVTLNFTYTDAQVSGLALSSLVVYYYNTATSAWVALPTTVDTATKTISATTNHFTTFAIFGSADAGTTPVDETPGAVSLVDVNGAALVDGDLVSTADSFDIYIASFVGTKRFKRLILNPEIFNSYGHLSWGNVKTVSQAVQDAFTLSDLVIEVNADGSVYDPKVYKVTSALNADVGQKQWLNMTAAQFELEGYDWDAIAHINHIEAGVNFYPLGTEITSAL